jgi:hypothetical protein
VADVTGNVSKTYLLQLASPAELLLHISLTFSIDISSTEPYIPPTEIPASISSQQRKSERDFQKFSKTYPWIVCRAGNVEVGVE